MRLTVAVAVACLIGGISLADDARASIKKQTNIPAQNLGAALQNLARERDVQVVYFSKSIDTLGTQGAVGELTIDEALGKLLSGSGLVYRYLDENTITIVPQSNGTPASQPTTYRPIAGIQPEGEEKQSFWSRLRLAHASSASQGEDRSEDPEKTTGAAQPDDSRQPQMRVGLEEIVVTAQKRSERIQDVPVPVTALSGTALAESNQLRLQDYFSKIPGFSVTPGVQSTTTLAIRGITTGLGTRPSVGIMVDDVPFGSSTANVIPDIDPGDLARVEVLRGPQGTLYGASSMGGLLKFVTLDPSTEEVAGRMQAGLSSVRNGDDPGYNVRGSVNVPLNDVVAVRASGFTRRDPGYIDDPVLGEEGVNQLTVSGGRLSALWRPSDSFSLELGALYQESEADGSSEAHRLTGLGGLEHSALRGSGWNDRELQVYSAMATAKVGKAEVISLTGYNINHAQDSFDASFIYGPFALNGIPGTPFTGFGVSGAATVVDYEASRFTQELRLAMPLGSRVDWLLGAFYTNEHSESRTQVPAVNTATGAVAGTLLTFIGPTTRYKEHAAFTNFTFHVTDQLDIQVGGRGSRIRQAYRATQSGPLAGLPTREVEAEDTVFTYLVTPQLRLSPSLMMYARLASGYRPGGPNGTPGQGTPAEYTADETRNYELGLKGDFLDRRLSVDASVYYIDWQDIQLAFINPNTRLGYNDNGGNARSQGVELAVEVRPATGLTLSAWATWTDAELTEAFPSRTSAFGVSGSRLPYSSRFSGNFSVEQEFPLGARLTGMLGGTLSYVGERLGTFRALALRQSLPSYAQTDLRAGVRFDAWTASLFATNVTDKRGVLVGGLGALPPYGFTYIQPRTIGLSIARAF